jgi:hypothetical protein
MSRVVLYFVMLSVFVLIVIMMSVFMLNAVAPQELLIGLFTLKIREKFSKQFYFSNLKDAVVS